MSHIEKSSSHHKRHRHLKAESKRPERSKNKSEISQKDESLNKRKTRMKEECLEDSHSDHKLGKKIKVENNSPELSHHRQGAYFSHGKQVKSEVADLKEDIFRSTVPLEEGGTTVRKFEHGTSYTKSVWKDDNEKPEERERPNFQPSGKLAEDTNMYKGVVIKYNEPNDAKLPKTYWRLYPFKGDESLPVMHIHRQSAYLIGRDPMIADIPVLHPSCSKQHAVLQYRLTSVKLSDGTSVKKVRPYIIDLNSANGTYLNDERIEAQRFLELREKDVLKFGFSSREYVLLRVEEEEKKKAK